MSILGNLRVPASLGSSNTTTSIRTFLHPSKVDLTGFDFTPLKHPNRLSERSHKKTAGPIQAYSYNTPIEVSSSSYEEEDEKASAATETFLLNAVNMSFLERLTLAWKIVFPPRSHHSSSSSAAARVAKQRLKMILFSDRCAVSDEAKRMIVGNIVRALSDFVEIESRDKVQLSVSADSDLGTVYSVTVPVRRVKPEYQDLDEPGSITNIEYKDNGDGSGGGAVDVRFDFYVPE